MQLNTFSILGDSPVETSRDRLNFTTFVEPFAERLIASVENSPFTVGIFADWGQGKSTVMQMLRSTVRKKGCATIWFEPWKHNTREAVWKGLALTLVTQVRDETSLMKEIQRKKKGLKTFAAKALWGHLIGREWAQDLLDVVQSEPWSPSLLHEFEQNLDTLFDIVQPGKAAGPRLPLVLFVDDLDRCLPDAALAVLEALKLVLSRQGLITIMGIAEAELSRSVLAAYAKEMGEAKLDFDPNWGQKYIRKIIQMPFPLPVISEKSFDNYIGSCLDESHVGPVLGNDNRWKEIIREACDSNLREVKRFINHFISEFDKASANAPANQASLNPPRVAFVLLLAWRFGDFLTYIRKQAGERDLLVRYQLYFAQKVSGGTAEASVLPDREDRFSSNASLQAFFNRCFTGDALLVLPFADWTDIEPYLQFGLRAPKPAPAAANAPAAPAPSQQASQAATISQSGSSAPARPVPASTPPTAPAPPSEAAKDVAARIQTMMSEGRFEEALTAARAAMTSIASSNDRNGEAALWDLIGSIYQSQQKDVEANEAYQRALDIFRAAGLKRESIGVLLNLARLNLDNDTNVARRFAEEGLSTAREIKDPLGEANALTDLADARKEAGEFEPAVELYNAAREIYSRLHFLRGELLTLGRLSEIYLDQDAEKAKSFNSMAYELADKLGDKDAQLRLLANRAHIEESINRFSENAQEYYERAIRLATSLGDRDEVSALEADFTRYKDTRAMKTTRPITVGPPVSVTRRRSKKSSRRLS